MAQEAPQKDNPKPDAKAAEKSSAPEKIVNAAQIELLETKVRFESNGDSRKEVHTLVKINSEVGARQFARLTFDFNRAFESVEIPFVRITHAAGGTADILPSAITDQPNPAVVNAPAYQDVRVKSVRILGLEPGDTLEYRVVRTVSHHPLAPDFWLDHTFDRSGLVSHEIFELDLPSSAAENAKANPYNEPFNINPATPITSTTKSGEGSSARTLYRWYSKDFTSKAPFSEKKEGAEPDIVFSTFDSWQSMSIKLAERLLPGAVPFEKISGYEDFQKEMDREPEVSGEIRTKAGELTRRSKGNKERLEAIYDFVSHRISTIDLPLGITRFAPRLAKNILATGYGTQEDKYALFAALATAAKLSARAALTGYCNEKGTPNPSVFRHLVVSAYDGKKSFWLDPSAEVAPFGMLLPNSGKCAFVLDRHFVYLNSLGHGWAPLDIEPPFASAQKVSVDATLAADGKLSAKVHYSMRGDNELLLRLAFHQSAKEKWKELAQLLSITDGFRGQVTTVTASDPYATREPFTLDYEITMPKFVDWSKKSVRIPALLPQLGLPDPPGRAAAGAAPPPIHLGTPLEVETQMTLRLPPGTTATAPTGTTVDRDYATYASQYSAKEATVTASRHIHFLLTEIPGTRAADYNAFLRAVQSDGAQLFTLEKTAGAPPEMKAAQPKTP
ncbi:MAG TPA: DUF3857 domain-containing protein [Candidatus Angelobacter sp.]|nr:DUF3857 domain-containing protein [Candidatus Angelobacter sp.]